MFFPALFWYWENRNEHPYKMNQVYRFIAYSRQAFHQRLDRQCREKEHEALVVPLLKQLREEHPGVAARVLYLILKPEGMGRDKFEQLCFAHGLKLPKARAWKKTTDSRGVIRFDNLLAQVELTGVNQVWVSDITYYAVLEEVFYLTFVMDLYSRKITGFSVSQTLFTKQTTLPALRMGLRQETPPAGLIFHSDGGGQYYCKAFIKLTKKYKIQNSMGESVYENPNAERINQTIKNQYLKGYNPHNYVQLVEMTKRAVNNYNFVRPHQSLNKVSPYEFEQQTMQNNVPPTKNKPRHQ